MLAVGLVGDGSPVGGALTLALMAVAAGATWHRWLPALFNLLAVADALLAAGGWVWNLYRRVYPYDEIAHATATLAVTLVAGFYLYRPLLPVFRQYPARFALALVTLGLAAGGLWEVAEWLGYHVLLGQSVMVLGDTITDLVVDGVGAVLAVPLGLRALRTHPAFLELS